MKRTSQAEVLARLKEALESGIDFTKHGWISEVLKITQCHVSTLKKVLKQHYPDIYEKCKKRKKTEYVQPNTVHKGSVSKDEVVAYLKENPHASINQIADYFDVSFKKIDKIMKENKIELDQKYVCKCGKEFDNKNSYGAHCSHCEIHLGHKPKIPFAGHQGWAKDISKNDPRYKSLRRAVITSQRPEVIEKRIESYKETYHNKSQEELNKQYEKQSNTMKKQYFENTRKLSSFIGRGKKSKILYNGEEIILRSTYELVFALFLRFLNIDFTYETARCCDEHKTYISDFVVDYHIFEVKGFHDKDSINSYIKAFNDSGYSVSVIDKEKINAIKCYLSCIFDIDTLLDSVKESYDEGYLLVLDLNHAFMIKN